MKLIFRHIAVEICYRTMLKSNFAQNLKALTNSSMHGTYEEEIMP